MKEYCQVARKFGQRLLGLRRLEPTGLLDALRPASRLTGSFRPLIETVPGDTSGQPAPMTSCDIILQGAGAQWITREVGDSTFGVQLSDAVT